MQVEFEEVVEGQVVDQEGGELVVVGWIYVVVGVVLFDVVLIEVVVFFVEVWLFVDYLQFCIVFEDVLLLVVWVEVGDWYVCGDVGGVMLVVWMIEMVVVVVEVDF